MSTLRAFTMPKWGIEMTEGIVTEWAVAEGEAFAKGQVLAMIETDKIVNEVDAEFDAVCLRRIAAEGDTRAVGELLAVFGDAGASAADVDAFVAGFVPADSATAGERGTAPAAPAAPSAPAQPAAIPHGIRISPLAARAAGARGVDLARVSGTGRHGRIQLQDVEQAARPARAKSRAPVDNAVTLGDFADVPATDVARRVAVARNLDLAAVKGSGKGGRVRVRDMVPGEAGAADRTRIPFSSMRAKIAERLAASWRDIPHYYLETQVRADVLQASRDAYNQHHPRSATMNDFVLRAVAKTLVDHPTVNAHVGNDELVTFRHAHVAIAVAIDGGLITPVVRAADALSFDDLCSATAGLVAKARGGNLSLDDLSGGTFTVTNLGMFGVTKFTALINPPQAAILAVGAARPAPVQTGDGYEFGLVMDLTLGCDHRVIDGAMGGRFLADLKSRLEDASTFVDD